MAGHRSNIFCYSIPKRCQHVIVLTWLDIEAIFWLKFTLTKENRLPIFSQNRQGSWPSISRSYYLEMLHCSVMAETSYLGSVCMSTSNTGTFNFSQITLFNLHFQGQTLWIIVFSLYIHTTWPLECCFATHFSCLIFMWQGQCYLKIIQHSIYNFYIHVVSEL